MQTQWRVAVGMGGAIWIGIDYSAIPAVLIEFRVPYRKRSRLVTDLRVMERAALPIMNARDKGSDGG